MNPCSAAKGVVGRGNPRCGRQVNGRKKKVPEGFGNKNILTVSYMLFCGFQGGVFDGRQGKTMHQTGVKLSEKVTLRLLSRDVVREEYKQCRHFSHLGTESE